MTSKVTTIETQHEDMIHDVQLDYYARRLATCSSDRTIKIYQLGENSNTLLSEIKGHEGPVWQIAWGHPKFGSILASCSYDRKVIIWKESSNNNWTKIYEYDHESSVNSISFAPHELGLILACASSDCSISIHSYKEDGWDVKKIPQAHAIGVNSVSWAPAIAPGSFISSSSQTSTIKSFVSGGCDNKVKIWKFSETDNTWRMEENLEHHTDWVRDVAWAPNIGLPYNFELATHSFEYVT
jgi:protein transport protein SEC13